MTMNLTSIKPARGAVKKKKRLGRGTGTGHGGTSTRGHKGVKARSGPNIPAWFEGGQMPLQRRLPKRGFTNIHAQEMLIVNVGDLERLQLEGEVTLSLLKEKGALSGRVKKLKILGDGQLNRALTVRADAFSRTAVTKIEAGGGKAEVIAAPRRPKRFARKVKA